MSMRVLIRLRILVAGIEPGEQLVVARQIPDDMIASACPGASKPGHVRISLA